MPSVIIHRLVGSADRSKAKIIAPAAQGSVHFLNHRLLRLPLETPLSHLAEFLADGADSLFRGACADKGSSGSQRVTLPDGIPQEVKALLGHSAGARLLFVDRQLERGHDRLHLASRFGRVAATENHEIVRIGDYPRLQLFFPTQFLPSHHKPSHVEVVPQRRNRRPLWSASSGVLRDGGAALSAACVLLY